jgi:hypothetical protein
LGLTNTGDKSVSFSDVLVLFFASPNTSVAETVSPASSANARAPDRMGKEGVTLAPGQTETLEFNALFFPQSLFLGYRVDGKPFEAVIGLGVRHGMLMGTEPPGQRSTATYDQMPLTFYESVPPDSMESMGPGITMWIRLETCLGKATLRCQGTRCML